MKKVKNQDILSMKLLHYFICNKNYKPVIVNGVENEIWLENNNETYRIIRIVLNKIINKEQYELDLLKIDNILSQIMYIDAQTRGENAQFTINGTAMTSTSNTVTSDISRLAGVTLTLKKVSTEEDGDTTLRVEQDSSSLVEAMKNFVSAYNDTISKIEEVTAKGADLQRESGLMSLKSTLRNYANGSNSATEGAYHLLSQIGISTLQANSDNLSTDTNKLEFDEQAFLQALEEDPDSLEALIGEETGILGQMESAIETSLKAVSG